MARLNTNVEVYHDLRTVGFYGDSATTTTLSSSVSAGDTSVPVTSASGIVAGDVVRIGAQGNTCDIIVVDSVASNTLTSKVKLAFDHANGAAVTELTFTDVGATSDAGVSFETTQDETPLAAGTQIATYLFMPGPTEQQFTFNLLSWNAENLAQAFGLSEATSDNYVHDTPEGVVLNQNSFASLGEKAWKFEGLREDATTVTMHAYSAKVSATNVTIAMTTGSAAEIPFTIRNTGAVHVFYE